MKGYVTEEGRRHCMVRKCIRNSKELSRI